MAEARRPPDLSLELTPSRLLAGLLAGAHTFAFVALAVTLPGVWLQLAAFVALSLHACWCLARHAWVSSPRAVAGMVMHGESACRLRLRGGQILETHVQGSTHVSTAMIVLHLRAAESGRRYSAVILPDHVGKDAFRRLRTRLRWCTIAAREEAAAEPSL